MKKKGFTLVELLAVIVILAIVALVVVPVVMSVIKDARKKSAIESFRGYMDAVEKTIIRDSMKTTSELPEKDSNGCYSLRELDSKVKVKGDHPEIEETDKLCVENGKIKSISEVEMNGYALEYKDGDILLNGQAIEDKTIPEITIGSITATTNSITIPYEVKSGKSGVTVTCEYGKTDSYGNQGTIEDNKCILSNLEEDTKYYFRLNSKTGKNKTANQASSATTEYSCEYSINQQFNFSYTGNIQQIKVCPGNYKLEVWGAAGGTETRNNLNIEGGYGGYSYGNLLITSPQELYVVVGGQGENATTINPTEDNTSFRNDGGYNGGGIGYGRDAGGGGATHIGMKKALLSSYENDYSSKLFIVAGGGGGGGGAGTGKNQYAYGGGTEGGISPKSRASGGTQTGPGTNHGTYANDIGKFGQGANATYMSSCDTAGGGGGLWGGNTYSETGNGDAGGGSGYVNTNKLTNASTIAGNQTFKAPSGSNETGHTGNGYARITYLGK